VLGELVLFLFLVALFAGVGLAIGILVARRMTRGGESSLSEDDEDREPRNDQPD
jgi:hypothetical protein